MTEEFVPFGAKPASPVSAEPFHVKVVPNASSPFHPVPTPGAHCAAQAKDKRAGQPEVSLVREGDRITAIRVRCACGEIIELQCVY